MPKESRRRIEAKEKGLWEVLGGRDVVCFFISKKRSEGRESAGLFK